MGVTERGVDVVVVDGVAAVELVDDVPAEQLQGVGESGGGSDGVLHGVGRWGDVGQLQGGGEDAGEFVGVDRAEVGFVGAGQERGHACRVLEAEGWEAGADERDSVAVA
ncbi:MAG: hypothetical protein QM733_18600 [Ilumatobacteraceae bacterium]